jgi:CubicO group peptidase (beta-lactamase class C family)
MSRSTLQPALSLLDAFVERQMRLDNLPGLSLALTDRQELLHVATYGYADLAARSPVQPHHLFEIGSISKSFTALALMQQREAGRVDLCAPLSCYLPWFHLPSRYDPITLHHLLTHSAGIIMGTEFSGEARFEVWALRETEASAAPGTTFHYSNVGYKALGLVLEAVTEQGYSEIIQERILGPLGMTASVAAITHETRRRMPVGYEPFYDDRPAPPDRPLAPATWLETATADGSIAATAADMAIYLRMLMNQGMGPGGALIAPESFQQMTHGWIPLPDDPAAHYGYGLVIRREGDHTLLGHEGGMVGYYAAMLADLDDGVGAVLLANGPGTLNRIARYALQVTGTALHGRPIPPPAEEPVPVADYVGTYRAEGRTFSLTAHAGRLQMEYRGGCVLLEPRGDDAFYAPHPDFDRFLLRFRRADGQVVEAVHGPDVYVGQHGGAPVRVDSPAEWAAYTGHYRAHNPWRSNFRVVLRQGELLLIEPWGAEHRLIPLGEGRFRVGEEEHSPERLRFDTLLDGRAIRANLSGCDYYRTFTP